MFSRVFAILAAVFAIFFVSNLSAQGKGDEKKGDKAGRAQTESAQELKALLTQQRDFVKGQFDECKNTILSERKYLKELADSPFADVRGKEAARTKLQRGDIYDPDLQLRLYKWAHRLVTAELELAEKKADRVAVHQAHVSRMKQMEDEYKNGHKGFSVEAKFQRLQAQIMLEQEKAR